MGNSILYILRHGGNAKQFFEHNDDWVDSIDHPMNEYFSYVRRGLVYHFKEKPKHRFIRKLYMSAGTDAHGDFNYLLSSHALVLLEYTEFLNWAKGGYSGIEGDNNAFGRARTYTLTCERTRKAGQFDGKELIPSDSGSKTEVCPADPLKHGDHIDLNKTPRASVMAYREGNTVLTDGPICTMSTDANCRFNSDPNSLVWHDKVCSYENYDGSIGGNGVFDGGGTMLAPVVPAFDKPTIGIKTKWKGRNDYLPEATGNQIKSRSIFISLDMKRMRRGK